MSKEQEPGSSVVHQFAYHNLAIISLKKTMNIGFIQRTGGDQALFVTSSV